MNLGKYILYRLGSLVVQIFGVVAFSYSLLAIIPYDPTVFFAFSYRGPDRQQELARLRHEYGIDVPIYQQYYNFFHRLFTEFSLGTSWISGDEVLTTYNSAFKYTFITFGIAFIIYTPLAIFLGFMAAYNHRGRFDNIIRVITTTTYSVPSFVLAVWLMMFFSPSRYIIFPTPAPTATIEIIKFSVLPIITVVLVFTSFQFRLVRNHVLTILRQNYIRTARAKGLSEKDVVFKHALRNALPFLFTSIAITFPIAFSGVAVLEVIFSIPGSGRLLVRSASFFDWPVIVGGTLLYTFINAIILGITDGLIYLVSPKLRYHYVSDLYL
ncbi:MAG: ABC transporter permease [Candidatus Kariarchaeaceae archaeon]|jgi:ABC-type dipeptide/oligopeptide/nickel transport system permease component